MSRSSTTAEETSMSAKVRMEPIYPGEILAEEYLAPLGATQHRLAVAIGVPPRRINEIVHGTRRISADTALRLARYFAIPSGSGSTSRVVTTSRWNETGLGPSSPRSARCAPPETSATELLSEFRDPIRRHPIDDHECAPIGPAIRVFETIGSMSTTAVASGSCSFSIDQAAVPSSRRSGTPGLQSAWPHDDSIPHDLATAHFTESPNHLRSPSSSAKARDIR